MTNNTTTSPLFLGAPSASSAYLDALGAAGRELLGALYERGTPTSGSVAKTIGDELPADILPEEGVGLDAALAEVRRGVLAHAVAVGHPDYLGHLHCPPLVSALAAEVLVSGANQSLDSFDQGPSAAVLESRIVEWLVELIGFGPNGDGVFTSGGTQSNLMGLLLARDRWGASTGRNVRADGLALNARWRVLCSRAAHFSVARAAATLGLGERCLVPIDVDPAGGLDVGHLERSLDLIDRRGEEAVALVLTAGTTESGAIDPLGPATELARQRGLWVHVDAALGGALLITDHRDRLAGVELADSVTIDFHKLLFQPVSCAVFMVRDGDSFEHLRCHAPYLNPEEEDGELPNLVWKSLQTTRRFDALKVFVSLRATGRHELAGLVDHTLETARVAADLIESSEDLRLLVPPATNIVLFRWAPDRGSWAEEVVTAVNRELPHRLWELQRAVIGRTVHEGAPALRLTITSPLTDGSSLASLVRSMETQASGLAVAYAASSEGVLR